MSNHKQDMSKSKQVRNLSDILINPKTLHQKNTVKLLVEVWEKYNREVSSFQDLWENKYYEAVLIRLWEELSK